MSGSATLRFCMANPSMTDEEIQFRRRAKHRLIGAVALVSGLVVFLPMVLDNEPKPVAEDIAINIPSQDAKPAKAVAVAPAPTAPAQPGQAPRAVSAEANAKPETPPPVQPLTVLPGGQAPKPASAETPHVEPVKNVKPAAAPSEPVKTASAPAVAAKPEKPAEAALELVKPAAPKENKQPAAAAPVAEKAKPVAKPAENSAPAQGGFVVRLGAFAKPENAKNLKAKLTSMGIRNYSDVLKTATGDKHRVRAGPYASKREAESVRERLKAVDLVGDVVPKP